MSDIEPTPVYDTFRVAETLLGNRMPAEAARIVEDVVKADPTSAQAWELLGRACLGAARLRAAEAAFRTLVELEPSSGWAHRALAVSLDRQSRREESARYHRLAEALGDDNAPRSSAG